VRRLVRNLGEVPERAERTLFGQAVISAVVVILLTTGVVWCLPGSILKRKLEPVVSPVAITVGLDQYWGVFAPNPPRQVETIEVHVMFPDGRDLLSRVAPRGEPLIGQYSWYHWQKLKENLVRNPGLRPSFCRWVARQVAGSGSAPNRVVMVLRTVTLPPPGTAVAAQTSATVLYDGMLTDNR
jgi:hypothetical protein